MAVSPSFAQFNVTGSREQFPDPFQDIASGAMPNSMRDALRWCEYIYSSFGTYRQAMERIISYFLTDVEISDASDEEKEKYEKFLRDSMDIFTSLQSMLRDRMCYGNAFATLLIPFRRHLACPKCHSQFPLRVVFNGPDFKFDWKDYEFSAVCPKCKYSGKWRVVDKPEDNEEKVGLKRWSPHEIELLHDPYTDEVSYLWRIPGDYKKLIKDGNLFHLERASLEVIKAVKYDKVFRFNPDVMFHMKEPSLAGIANRGWGIPRILSNFRQIYYVQVLHRFNEAIALDYVIPFRLITPEARSGAGIAGGQSVDPLATFSGGDFRSAVSNMIRKRRKDPASWQILPFPVNYQMLGGDANKLAPKELLDQGIEKLLNDAGTPVEMYQGTLQLQTAPTALRLFEATWHHLVHDTNSFLQWVVKQISQVMSWEVVECRLKRVTIADDMNKQMAVMQLMMGQQVSGTSGLKAIGYDWKDEQRLLGEEASFSQEQQARMQEEMEQAGFAAEVAKGQPAGGAPPPGGGAPVDPAANPAGPDAASAMGAGGYPVTSYVESMSPQTPQTPQDLMATAASLAQQLLGLPEGIKDSELRKLKQKNEVLHSLVRAEMDKIRGEARTQGGAQILQQQFGGGG